MARSERLTFAWDAQGVRLVRRITREKPAPRGDSLEKPPRPEDLWAEVRSARGDVLYRRALPDAIPQYKEVFEPDGRIRSVPAAPASGVFSLVVPVDARTEEVVVVAGPEAELAQPGLLPPEGAEGPRELARVSLRQG